ncbi:hypothetical protein QAD02_001987 [Eretmocerus hayati]|uniref:Uncharacterized protein n=1 Tax=Eretmocerus hayati TaxID=131215 RepID=A0ACC2NIU4_9HYME|nr:hypothetical protein QAD02_001987 [Eretmocerus hayati]
MADLYTHRQRRALDELIVSEVFFQHPWCCSCVVDDDVDENDCGELLRDEALRGRTVELLRKQQKCYTNGLPAGPLRSNRDMLMTADDVAAAVLPSRPSFAEVRFSLDFYKPTCYKLQELLAPSSFAGRRSLQLRCTKTNKIDSN